MQTAPRKYFRGAVTSAFFISNYLHFIFRHNLSCYFYLTVIYLKLPVIFNLKTGDIFIRKSKRGKDRHIIVSDDMRDLCTVYNGLAGKREWFFQYPDGGQIPTRWAQWHFSKAWRKSTLFSRGNNPRPYDLRHNFATRTLMRWIDEGRDVMALMPYLSTYMGHVSLEETLYYIHLLPERLKSSPGIDWKMLNDIYQTEEGSDEED